MENPTGESADGVLRLDFDRRLTLQFRGSAGWDIVATGDFVGDGQTDLVWRNHITGEDGVWILGGFDPIGQVVHTAHYASLPRRVT